jgi:Cof subfamily protein (haloacid dehalogenase superfamily)
LYRMIAIDIDDTLLNDNMLITNRTKEAIYAAVSQNVIVTLATGRMFPSAQMFAKQLNLNVPLISYQGSKVTNLLDGKLLYERTVPIEISEKVFQYAQQQGLHLQVYYNDILIGKEHNAKIKRYADTMGLSYSVEQDFFSLSALPLTKLLIIEDPKNLEQIENDFRRAFGNLVHITKSKPEYLEVLHLEGTKGCAINFLAGHFGIDMSQVIAIGDSWNDHDMIEMAGLGVAMGNAIASLKEKADYVSLTNNDDGVAHVIEKFILKT